MKPLFLELLPYALIILPLATWRLTSLVVDESGPWGIFEKLRVKAGVRHDPSPPYERHATTSLSQGIICSWCVSTWVGGMGLVYFLFPIFTLVVAFPLALSTLAIFIDSFLKPED